MPITIGGTPIGERALVTAFGDALITLVESAWAAGACDEKLPKMRAWLEANAGHPRWSERDSRYWAVVNERNQAQGRISDCTSTLAGLQRQISEGTIREMEEMMGCMVDTTPVITQQIGHQVADLARRHQGLNVWGVLDQWAMEQTSRQERMGP